MNQQEQTAAEGQLFYLFIYFFAASLNSVKFRCFYSQITSVLCREARTDRSVQSNLRLSSIIVWYVATNENTPSCGYRFCFCPPFFLNIFYFLCCSAETELFITPVVICYIVLLPWKHVTFEMDMGRQQFGARLCVSNSKRDRGRYRSLFFKYLWVLEMFWCESRGWMNFVSSENLFVIPLQAFWSHVCFLDPRLGVNKSLQLQLCATCAPSLLCCHFAICDS